ncbi:MAG: extracellular solute-binding protein [Spirochaetota bacterium]|nr:extracellular solute-binding protein [Spirochaetota bacterium]
MKRRNRKNLSKMLLVGVIMLLLAPYSLFAGGEQEAQASDEEAPAVVRLVSERGSHTEAWKTRMEGFEAETGINLELTQHPYANYFDQLMLNFTGGQSGFDVPYVSMLWYPALAKAGYIQPLNEIVEANPELADDMPGLVNASIDGKLYFIPYMNEVGGVVYRTDLFNDPVERKNFKAKYGYDLMPPKTLEQYRDIAEFFHRPPELYGVTLMGKRSIFLATHFMNRLWARGGNLLGDDMQPIFDSEIGITALKEAKDMFAFANTAALSYDFQEALTEFKMGKSAMAELWTTAMFHVSDPESSQVVGNASFVGFPKPADAQNEKRPRLYISWGFAVASDAENKEAAIDWIEYAIGDKQLAEASPTGNIPTRLSALEDRVLLEELPWLEPFQEALGSCIPTPIVPLIPEGMTMVNQFIAPAVSEYLTGNMSAEAALQEAAQKTHDLLKENGYYD